MAKLLYTYYWFYCQTKLLLKFYWKQCIGSFGHATCQRKSCSSFPFPGMTGTVLNSNIQIGTWICHDWITSEHMYWITAVVIVKSCCNIHYLNCRIFGWAKAILTNSVYSNRGAFMLVFSISEVYHLYEVQKCLLA